MAETARLNVKVDADAKQASAAFKDLAKNIKDVGDVTVGVKEGVDRVDSAIAKLAKAPDTPLALGRAIAKAKVEVEDLRAALEKTPASAERMKSIATAVAAAESAIAKATSRAGRLKDAMEETSLSVDKAKDRVSQLGGALSSPTAMFDKMRDSTSGFDQAIGKLGGSLIVAKQGFDLARDAGKALAEAIDEWDKKRAANDKSSADAAVNTIKFQQALRLAEKGTIDLGRSTEAMIRNYDAYVAKTSPAAKAARDMATALEEQKRAAEELKGVLDDLGKKTSFTIRGPEDMFMPIDEAQKYAERLNDILAKAFKEGGSEERDKWAQANEEMLNRVLDAYKAWGKTAPEEVRKAYDAMSEAASTANWLKEGNAGWEAALRKQKEWLDQTTRVEEGMRKWTDATQGASSAFGALSGDFTQINQAVGEFLAAGGQLQNLQVGMAEVTMSWQRSTEAMNQTLERQLELMGRLDEQMVQTLDKYEQWRSAIATAVSSLQDGTTSSAGFIEMMNQLATQLSQNFGAAAGEAGEEVRKLIATIHALIATATMGGSTNIDPTLWGGLERQFGKGKK